MAKSKKLKLPTNYDFESANQEYDFTKICRDMQRSKAWHELNLRQQGLYLHLKSKFRVNRETLENNANDISIPTSEAKEKYGNLNTFRKDMDTLIDYGFIKQIVSGVPTMSVSIYGFSYRWKDYGTERFFIPNEDRRYKKKPKENK